MHQRSFEKYMLLLMLLISIGGCASQKRLVQDPQLLRKMDAHLRSVLSSRRSMRELDRYVKLIVTYSSAITSEDQNVLQTMCSIGTVLGPFATVTIQPKSIIRVAVLDRVIHIRLSTVQDLYPIPPMMESMR